MPPLPAVANVVKMQCLGTNEGQAWANVFHAQYTGGPPTDADAAALAAFVFAKYQADFIPIIGENWHLQEVKITDLTSDTSAAGESTGDVGGGNIGPTWPAQVCCCISWPIARRYRGGHPRTYLPPGIQTDQIDTSHWKPAYMAAVEAAATAFRSDINAHVASGFSTLTLGAVSYVLAGAPRAVPLFFAFGLPGVHSRIDTQRRRLGRELT